MANDITVEELGLYMAGVKKDIVYPDRLSEPMIEKVEEEQAHE